jgi:hypothetical protein
MKRKTVKKRDAGKVSMTIEVYAHVRPKLAARVSRRHAQDPPGRVPTSYGGQAATHVRTYARAIIHTWTTN